MCHFLIRNIFRFYCNFDRFQILTTSDQLNIIAWRYRNILASRTIVTMPAKDLQIRNNNNVLVQPNRFTFHFTRKFYIISPIGVCLIVCPIFTSTGSAICSVYMEFLAWKWTFEYTNQREHTNSRSDLPDTVACVIWSAYTCLGRFTHLHLFKSKLETFYRRRKIELVHGTYQMIVVWH